MRQTLLGLLVCIGLSGWAQDGSRWYSWAEASGLAQSRNQLLLVYFWQTGCPYCDQMNRFVFSDPAVLELMNRYTIATVNIDSAEGRLSRSYRTPAPPPLWCRNPKPEAGSLWPGWWSHSRAQFFQVLLVACKAGGGCE
jgi:thiol-disulfide isomerase/thioredoxin